MAKDLVDSDPLDPDRRAALVDVLQAAGRYDAAAIAARQAADVMPEHLSLRIRSIRAWIRADKPVDARQDLNEALARDPNSQEVLVLSATIAVATEDPAKAIEESEKAIKGGAGSEAFFIRAIARSMLGGSDGVRLDLTQAFKTEITPGELAERYRFAMRLLGDLSVKAGEDLQTVVQRASIKRTDTEVRRSMELLRNQASARSEFLALFPPPPTRKLSHERWVLVQKLLSQCLAELDQFVKDGSDDTLFDCRINLGEAIKQANAAKAAANAEKTSASSGSNLSP
jgi:tetratricopeptide (TPR) repeat protein